MSIWYRNRTHIVIHMTMSCHGGRQSPAAKRRHRTACGECQWHAPVSRSRGVPLCPTAAIDPAPSTSSSAASPVRLRTLASAGVQGNHGPAAPARLCRAARDACLVEFSCHPCCAGVCSAPHHRQHLARRSATTSASVLVHDCITCCTCFAKLTGAGPYHVLTGAVALFRTGKRLLVV